MTEQLHFHFRCKEGADILATDRIQTSDTLVTPSMKWGLLWWKGPSETIWNTFSIKMVNHKYYCFPRENTENCFTIRDLKDEMCLFLLILFYLLIELVQEIDCSWRMKVYFHRLNQEVIPYALIVPTVVSLSGQTLQTAI